MPRLSSVNDIINRVAVEIGLNKTTDPVASTDESFVQLRGLLDSAGQELVRLHQWQIMSGEFSFTTQDGDTGIYDLPDDFAYMVDQTGWDRSSNVPLGGHCPRRTGRTWKVAIWSVNRYTPRSSSTRTSYTCTRNPHRRVSTSVLSTSRGIGLHSRQILPSGWILSRQAPMCACTTRY